MTDVARTVPGLKIPAVDGRLMDADILQRLLLRCGPTCEIARDGVEAAEMADANRFDVILTEIRTARMDGIAATREVARRLSPDGPRVIAATANATSDVEGECAVAGFAGFPPEPVRIETLRAALGETHEAA